MNYKRQLLVATIVLLCDLGASAQSLLMKHKNISVKTAMNELKQKSGYTFVFESGDLDTNKKINVNASSVNQAVSQILNGQSVSYVIEGKTIVVRRQARQTSSSTKGLKNVPIKGHIIDENGEPVVGATVRPEGGAGGTITDIDGNFTLDVPENSQLIVSYIGYDDQTVKASDNMSIRLKVNVKALDEVVVVGYGKQSEKLITTSISTLKLDDVDQGNDNNVAKMLQGRVTGVSVSTPSGTPGQQPNVRVRGIASISGNSTPLYVVDGIPSESMPVLNPNDVERMDILKDASAAAIYGSRANNGVVIITSKSGKLNGQTSVGATVRHSIGWIAHDIKMANASQYMRTMQQAVDNYNVQMGETREFVVPDHIVDTDWVGLIQRNAAHTTNANINLSGGNSKTTFFTSIGVNDQQGIIRKSSALQTNVRAKFSHIINSVVKLNLNLTGSYTKYNKIEDSDLSLKVIRTAREEQPWVGPYAADGSYNKNGGFLVRHNPVMLINEEDWVIAKKQGVASVNFEITPFKGLKYTPSFSLYGILDDGKKTITERHDARKAYAGWGAITQQRDESCRMVFDNVFSYENNFDKLLYSVMLGHSYEKYVYETFGARSDNYAEGAFPSSSFGLINSGTNIYAAGIGYNAYAIESYFGRLALNWDNRYILNATVRSDGSSRFSKNHRYGTFPSASFAWRVSNEPFFPKNSAMNDLKIRLSWGQTGSMDGISNWSAMSLVTSGGSSYNGASGFRVGNDAQNLSWEKANQFNVGINAEFFKERLVLSLDGYYDRTTGLLYNTSTISTSGYSSLTTNIGKLENQGLEFMVNGQIFDTKNFKWNLTSNISYVKNRLLSLDGTLYMSIINGGANTGRTMHALIVGKPISAYYMLQQEGLYQTDAEVPAKLYVKGVRAGDCKYTDYNGDGDITDEDRMYVGKVTPDFYGGITSTMHWKNFDLSVFCQYAVGGKILAAWRGSGGVEGTETLGLTSSNVSLIRNGVVTSADQFYNISEYAATHYWRGEGTSNTVPRPTLAGTFTGGYGNNLVSTRYLEDASYFKFKTITLGYNIPASVLSKIHIKSMHLYLSLDNFFTFTKYNGYDPEFSYQSSPTGNAYGSDFGEQATLKSLIIGTNINF